MGKLDGKIAVVTGGSSGIGLATAKRFASEGAFVFITGRRQKELEAAAREIGAGTIAIQGDSGKVADLERIFSEVKEKKGRIDVLFVNAGGGEFRPLEQVTEEHFDWIFGSNVKGVLFTVQKAIPLLSQGASVILNASVVSIKGSPAFSVYAATKAAVRSFARSWILEFKDRFRINVLSPGPVDTPGLNGLNANEEEARKFKEGLAAGVPLGRIADPDEMATVAVFLASSDSSYVNGVELFADGGMGQV